MQLETSSTAQTGNDGENGTAQVNSTVGLTLSTPPPPLNCTLRQKFTTKRVCALHRVWELNERSRES